MFGILFAFLANVFSVFNSLFKTLSSWIIGKLYLLLIPIIAAAKLVYDFCRATLDKMMLYLDSLDYSVGSIPAVPDLLSFVNAYFPVNTFVAVLSIIISFWLACVSISGLIKIKQMVFA